MKFVDKKTYIIKVVVTLAMLWSGLGISAQEENTQDDWEEDQTIVFATQPSIMTFKKADMLSIGHSSMLDTYLSPEHYSGIELRYIGERRKWTNFPCRYITWKSEGRISETKPRSENASELSAMYEFSAGYYKMNWPAYWNKLYLSYGALADIFLGGTYNTRNGNNPAQMHAGIDIAPGLKAEYLFHLFKKNMKLNYEVSVPLFGVQFSPAYGQSYYEIFSRGNYDHNICFTSPLNAASLSNRLTIDIPMKRGAIRVGYIGDFRQAKLNDIKFHNFTHGFVIGYAY